MVVVTVGFRGDRGVGLPVGQPGQFVGFGPGGAPVAVSLPDGTLPAGEAGQFVSYDEQGNPIAVDAPTGTGYDDTPLANRVAALEQEPAPTWDEVTGKPTEFTPAAHTHTIADVTNLQTTLDGKAAAASVPTTEQLQDLVAAMFQGGTHTNVTVTYDDAAGTISVSASGGGGTGGLTQEQVEDIVGNLVQVQGTGISVTYDDAGNVLRIALTGETYTTAEKTKLAGIATAATANASDAELRDRATHTGTQAISTVTGLQTALDGKQAATTFKTVNGQTVTGTGDIVTAVSFATDAEAEAYSAANPGVAVFSSEVV